MSNAAMNGTPARTGEDRGVWQVVGVPPGAGTAVTTYEVFCRPGHDSELERVGSIDAASEEAARAIAWYAYDGFAQVEMWLVPRDCVVRQHRPRQVMDDRVLQTLLRGRTVSR